VNSRKKELIFKRLGYVNFFQNSIFWLQATSRKLQATSHKPQATSIDPYTMIHKPIIAESLKQAPIKA
jgi:hypothetical protein